MDRSKTSKIRFLEKRGIARMTSREIKASNITAYVRSRRRPGCE